MDETNIEILKGEIIGNSLNIEDNGCSEYTASSQTRICLFGKLGGDPKIYEAAQKFGVPVVVSETVDEYLNDKLYDTVFVLEEFEGPVYDTIHQSEQRVMGPTALVQSSQLPPNPRPLYSLAMAGVVVCFTGFRKKKELSNLSSLIRHMGGSIRKEMVSKVTHLIANCCGGEKYQYAVTFNVPIMSESWVRASWDLRDQPGVKATGDSLMVGHRLKPFHGARVCFYGFPEEENQHMQEVLQENGGSSADMDDQECSHVVVDESSVQNIPDRTPVRALMVKVEWFWSSVQNEACADEKEYLFEDYLEAMLNPERCSSRGGSFSVMSASRARTRKRLQEAVSRLLKNDSLAVPKRRSLVSDAGLLSCTTSSDKQTDEVEAVNSDTPRKIFTPRQQVFLELMQTESNYVGILHTIMTLFKSPLDDMVEGEGCLLNNTELKMIFRLLPPIYEVHKQMLEELRKAATHWKEDISVGKIFLKFVPDLMKAYPPFVNFFDEMRNELVRCDQSKPRFHAFLKICETKAECSRQSLQELLVRPVQHLPSISLLLNDILKNTSKGNMDHGFLEQALSGIKEVMTHINEDRRKTEVQLATFDIFHEIDNCPELGSSVKEGPSYVAPMSLQPTRKNKSLSPTMVAFKRL